MNPQEQELSIDRLLGDRTVDPKRLHQQAAKLTRRKILLAAMECFAANGYQKTTIRRIAARAGVTLGAVYHHFKGKKELLMIVNRSRQINSWEILRTALAEEQDFFEALRTALRGQFKLLATDRILRGVTREYMGMAMVDPDVNRMHSRSDIEFCDIFARELERRHPELSPNERASLVRMLLVAFEGLMTAVVVDSPITADPEEILDALVETFRRAPARGDSNKSPD